MYSFSNPSSILIKIGFLFGSNSSNKKAPLTSSNPENICRTSMIINTTLIVLPRWSQGPMCSSFHSEFLSSCIKLCAPSLSRRSPVDFFSKTYVDVNDTVSGSTFFCWYYLLHLVAFHSLVFFIFFFDPLFSIFRHHSFFEVHGLKFITVSESPTYFCSNTVHFHHIVYIIFVALISIFNLLLFSSFSLYNY